MSFDLVVFDMDGTVVDSEGMAERVVSRATQLLSKPITAEDAARLFRGRTVGYMLEEIERIEGGPPPEEFLARLSEDYIRACETELEATPGVEAAIKAILPTPICIASNGEPEAIERSLRCVGLIDYFDGHLFSASDVGAPKPAPDLFLHAARSMGVAPERCIAIEDSPLGVRAALDAGMTVVGFAGNHREVAGDLEALGVPVVFEMSAFVDILRAGL